MDGHVLRTAWDALGGNPARLGQVRFHGTDRLPSAYPVTGFAAGTMAAAALALADHAGSTGPVEVDRRLASLWFGVSFQAHGWTAPASWDAVAGDYQAADGWIRLHTNARHHRAAALAVLGAAPDRTAVAEAVRSWPATALEDAVVAAGGCAAAMMSTREWAAHPQGRAVAAEPLVWREASEATGAELPPPTAGRPLHGVRVLDLTRVLAGPVCTRFLAGFGADVLRIDSPDWDEPGVVPDVTLGKRCARLDARDDAGRDALHALLAGADVLVHGYRPGALDRLGLDAATRQRLRPGLVDVCLDAYGWTGPWAGRRGFDSLVQMSGGIAATGMEAFGRDRPTPLPVQALDHGTGYLMAAAVLRALADRRATGHGQSARASLARTAALLTDGRPGDPGGTLAGPGDGDFATDLERTAWGPMRRLRPAVAVAGSDMRWDRPAGPLGRDPPGW